MVYKTYYDSPVGKLLIASDGENIIGLCIEEQKYYLDKIEKEGIEKEHEARYKKLIENVEGGLVFSRDGDRIWKCRNCGHIVIGKSAPEICPVCSHPKAFFEIKAENY